MRALSTAAWMRLAVLTPPCNGSGVSSEWLLTSWCACLFLSPSPSSSESSSCPPPPPRPWMFWPEQCVLPAALLLALALLLPCPGVAPERPVPCVEVSLEALAGPDWDCVVSPACGENWLLGAGLGVLTSNCHSGSVLSAVVGLLQARMNAACCCCCCC